MNYPAVVSVVLSCIFGSLFWADIEGRFTTIAEPIGFVKESEGSIRRLGAKDLTWDRASEGAIIGNEDTIATGEEGYARLVFYAGGELELAPGAMVFLGGSVDELKLDFVSGQGRIRVAKEAKGRIRVAKYGASRDDSRNEENTSSKTLSERELVSLSRLRAGESVEGARKRIRKGIGEAAPEELRRRLFASLDLQAVRIKKNESLDDARKRVLEALESGKLAPRPGQSKNQARISALALLDASFYRVEKGASYVSARKRLLDAFKRGDLKPQAGESVKEAKRRAVKRLEESLASAYPGQTIEEVRRVAEVAQKKGQLRNAAISPKKRKTRIQIEEVESIDVSRPVATKPVLTDDAVDSKSASVDGTKKKRSKKVEPTRRDLVGKGLASSLGLQSSFLGGSAIKESQIRNLKAALSAEDGKVLTVQQLPPTPELLGPEGGVVVDLAKKRALLTWAPIPNARYEVLLRAEDGEGKPRLLRTKRARVSINQLKAGRYLWSVRAVRKGKRGPASQVRTLEVKKTTRLGAPTVLPVLIR